MDIVGGPAGKGYESSALLLRRVLLLAVGIAVGFLVPQLVGIGNPADDGGVTTVGGAGEDNAIAANPKPTGGFLKRFGKAGNGPAKVTSFTKDDPHAVGDKTWKDSGGGTRLRIAMPTTMRTMSFGLSDPDVQPVSTRIPGRKIRGYGTGGMQLDESVINATQAIVSLQPRVVLLRCAAESGHNWICHDQKRRHPFRPRRDGAHSTLVRLSGLFVIPITRA